MSRAEVARGRFPPELLDQLADIVLELETDGRITSINRAAGRAFGIGPEQIVGRSLVEYIAPEDRDRTIAAFRKVVEAGEDLTLRFRAPRQDGLRVSFEAAFRAYSRSDGRRMITAVCRDVTQHESASQVDRLRHARYHELVDSGLQATAIARSDGSIHFVNRPFKSIFGAIEDIDGLIPRLRVAYGKVLTDAWFEATRENAPRSGAVDLELNAQPGGPLWVSLRWGAFESEAGERLFGIQAEDISRHKQVELAFMRLAQGVEIDDSQSVRSMIASLAKALELDRLVWARLDPVVPDRAILIGGWQDGEDLAPGALSLAGLPEAIAARGEFCVHPAGVTRLLSEVADRLDPGFVAFAGIGLRSPRDHRVLGLLAGYARHPLSDSERVRNLLTSASLPLARALEESARRPAKSTSPGRITTRIAASGPVERPGSPRWSELDREASPAPTHDPGRDLLHRVIQQSTDLVFVCDLDTTVLFANDTANRHLRTARSDDPAGRTLFDLLTPGDAQRLRNEVLPRLTTRFPWSGELSLVGESDEQSIPTDATVLLFCDPIGPTEAPTLRSYVAVTLRDISARRRTEEALRQSELRLGQSRKLESVGRLAGGIAHDFNNLLTAIIGYGDLVLQELDPENAARPDVEEILRAAERASGLTRQLLAFSRRQSLRPERVDLNAVVAEIDRMLRRLIGEDIELVSQLHGELEPILADPGQIEQVILNLVVNARDAMPHGGRLELETFNHFAATPEHVESGVLAPGAYVALRVSDTGTGMDETTRNQIFEPFFTTKGAAGGTGLGLATVHGIVSQSRGQIDVTSRLGHGSSFTVYLPTVDELLVESRADELAIAGRGRETVLVVEDSQPVRQLVERTLHRRGYTVLGAESATAALRHCSRHEGPIDLLLTDVVLPRMAGPAIAQRARELRPDLRVLFMSGFTDETLSEHGLANAGSQLLEKPFSSAALLARVRQVLEEPSGELPKSAFLVEQSLQDQEVEV